MRNLKNVLAGVGLAALFAVAVPVAAQNQEGLVNVNVSDITVQVPVAIAANVCGVAVNVLSEQLPGDVECNADAESAAENEQFMRFAERQGKAQAIRDAA
jgi:hypothetical protein